MRAKKKEKKELQRSGDLVATLNKLKDNQKLLDMSLQAPPGQEQKRSQISIRDPYFFSAQFYNHSESAQKEQNFLEK